VIFVGISSDKAHYLVSACFLERHRLPLPPAGETSVTEVPVLQPVDGLCFICHWGGFVGTNRMGVV